MHEVHEHYPLLQALLRIKGLALQPTYTTADVAILFRVSQRTIQHMAAKRVIPSRKLIGHARFLPVDLETFLRQGQSATEA